MCFAAHGPSPGLPLWFIAVGAFVVGFLLEQRMPTRSVGFELGVWGSFCAATLAVGVARFVWLFPGCNLRDFELSSASGYALIALAPAVGTLLFRARFQRSAPVGTVRRALESGVASVAGIALVLGTLFLISSPMNESLR